MNYSQKIVSYLSKIFTLKYVQKICLAMCTDSFCIVVAFFVAFHIRLDNFLWISSSHFIVLLLLVIITIVLLNIFKFYSVALRYFSLQSTIPLVKASILSSIILFLLSNAFGAEMPRSIPFIYALIFILQAILVRCLIRAVYTYTMWKKKSSPIIIYGAGETGRQICAALQLGNLHTPVAFVDDLKRLQGRSILGLVVYGFSSLPQIIEEYSAKKILLAMPRLRRSERKKIIEKLLPLNIEICSVPNISELASTAQSNLVQDVSVEDILGRDPVVPIPHMLEETVKDKNVLVSGAGGSIGSEICRQVIAGGANTLVLFEISEVSLYVISKELESSFPHARARLVPLLGSVQNKELLTEIMQKFSIQTVYHAAAYKHVPIVEYNCIEAVKNNIFGTLACLQASIAAKAERFVLISTDKAVRPTNVMGATKRMAEIILQAYAARFHETAICMVRFGNVLGSSGSVVPLFKKQIAAGGPITVTHPDIERYFMTIPEAVQLVLQAGSMGNYGEVFVLEMGKPVKIMALAQKMIRLSGLKMRDSEHPDGDIAIVISGLRPGEKLSEELFIDGELQKTKHPSILHKQEDCLTYEEVGKLLKVLQECCQTRNINALRTVLQMPCVNFTPDAQVADILWQQSHHEYELQTVGVCL